VPCRRVIYQLHGPAWHYDNDQEWQVTRYQLVDKPANVDKLGPSKCDMPNEWLEHRNAHFKILLGTLGQIGFGRADAVKVTSPVLTIHGTKDRNAPYGCGREWSLILSNARLITIQDAAHFS
jgi:pimeloyl-ACP methyl ester carboxylesterase